MYTLLVPRLCDGAKKDFVVDLNFTVVLADRIMSGFFWNGRSEKVMVYLWNGSFLLRMIEQPRHDRPRWRASVRQFIKHRRGRNRKKIWGYKSAKKVNLWEKKNLVDLKDVLSEIYQARKLRQHSSRIRSDSLIWFNNVRNFGDETWISNHFPRQKLQPEYSAKFVRTILTAFLSQFNSKSSFKTAKQCFITCTITRRKRTYN